MAKPLLLTYNLNPDVMDKLSALCGRMDIALREVKPYDYYLPVGAMAGLPFAGPGKFSLLPPFPEGMLVICHMLSDQLDALLNEMRRAGIPSIALKAVLTPNNVTWSSAKLYEELKREHAAMGGRK